ncbi:hypothetical protein [Caudoviricetes sp.]|nr:hypothetical protein [Caudoviricetes sp.]
MYPYVPHLTHFWDIVSHKETLDWLHLDKVWLASCDAMVRLPGESRGADIEEEFALRRGIPVFHSVADCVKFFPKERLILHPFDEGA